MIPISVGVVGSYAMSQEVVVGGGWSKLGWLRLGSQPIPAGTRGCISQHNAAQQQHVTHCSAIKPLR